MSSNVGSSIVLNNAEQLEAVLHTEGNFTDAALKARLFSWPLPFISCPFKDLLLGRKANHTCPGDVGLLPSVQYFLWKVTSTELEDKLSLRLTSLGGLSELQNGRYQNSY